MKPLYSEVVKRGNGYQKLMSGIYGGKLPDWAKKLPTFKGDPAKDDLRFRDWIRMIEVQFTIFGLPKRQYFFVLMCLLDPAVTKYLQDVDPSKYSTYATQKEYVEQLFYSRLDSKDAHMNTFYSLTQGENETSVRYIQRLQIKLFKGKPKLKTNDPKSIRRRHGFLKECFLEGLNLRYRDLLEITNLDRMRTITFDQLQKQAYEIDQRSLDQVHRIRTQSYGGVAVAGAEEK